MGTPAGGAESGIHFTSMVKQTALGGPTKIGYLPSLDGWRAVAILGVMLTHDRPWVPFGHSMRLYQGFGGYGVQLFFAISGLLITTRILEEEALCGSFHVWGFYVRRLFRIQPASLVYLGFAALLMALAVTPSEWRPWWLALAMVGNFFQQPPWPPSLVNHFWTLAVEEHFYILLALLMVWVKRRRVLTLALLYAAFTAPVVFSYGMRRGWYDPGIHPRSTQWQLFPLLLAALVAVLLRKPGVTQWVRRWLQPYTAVALTIVLVLLHNTEEQWREGVHPRPLHYLHTQVEFTLVYLPVLWLVATVFHPRSWTTRLLELPPLRYLGRISYSLYLWHVMVFYLWRELLFANGGPMTHVHSRLLLHLGERPARYAAAVGIAMLSYYLIEKPLIRVGHRLAPPATPGRPEFADLPVEAPATTVAAAQG